MTPPRLSGVLLHPTSLPGPHGAGDLGPDTLRFLDWLRSTGLRAWQVLRSVSGPKTTKLGTGRFWVIDVVYRNQDGELVGIETYTGFGYRRDAS